MKEGAGLFDYVGFLNRLALHGGCDVAFPFRQQGRHPKTSFSELNPPAHAHSLGHDLDNLLTFDLWRHIFGNPDTIIADWLTYLNGPLDEVRANAGRSRLHTGSRVNRPTGWTSSPSPPAD